MYLRISSWITTRTARCRSRFGHRAAIACSELVLALTATQPHAATLPRQQRPFANCPLSRPRSVPRNAVTDNSRPTLPIPAHRRGRPRTQTFGTGAAYLTPRVVARGGPRPSADRPPTTLTGHRPHWPARLHHCPNTQQQLPTIFRYKCEQFYESVMFL